MQTAIFRLAPVLGVPSVRQAAEYYRDVLGFTLDLSDGIFQPSPDEPDGVYGIVKWGNAWVHFQIRRDAAPARDRAVYERDVYLYVDDVAAAYAAAAGQGATIIQPLCDTHYGIREFTVEDLNGFRLTFGQPL